MSFLYHPHHILSSPACCKPDKMSTSKHAYQGLYPICWQLVCISANLANHFTGFCPDELSGTVAHSSGLGLTSPASSTGDCIPKLKYENKDPFTSPGAKLGSEQKLSATASTFQPYSVRLNHGSMHALAGNRDTQPSDTVKIANPTKETTNLWNQYLQPTALPLVLGSRASSALILKLPVLLEYLEYT